MTATYHGIPIDTMPTPDGRWHAYANRMQVSDEPLGTIDAALKYATGWIDAAEAEQEQRRRRTDHLLAGIADERWRPARNVNWHLRARVIHCDRDREAAMLGVD